MNEPLIFKLDGDLDVYRCDGLERTLMPARESPYVILDLSEVRYIDSSCLAALVRMRKARTAKGFEPAVVVKGPAQVQRVFEVTRLDELWRMCDSMDEARTLIEQMAAAQR